ncbi:MAG: DUF2269 domain-containing protein [Methylobacteriaceae bacterium]|nr:DUF2269 domain-containing protein [Methylobacteriaceae bacterium]
MSTLEILRWLHVVGATVLLGAGVGIAFFMLMAHRTGNPLLIAHVASTVVIADFVFTATAVIAQPITGYFLARMEGWSLNDGWLLLSISLYVLTGLFWLPVVFLQIRMRDLAREAARTDTTLATKYFELFWLWFLCGIPAFSAVMVIVWLMLAKPAIPL